MGFGLTVFLYNIIWSPPPTPREYLEEFNLLDSLVESDPLHLRTHFASHSANAAKTSHLGGILAFLADNLNLTEPVTERTGREQGNFFSDL